MKELDVDQAPAPATIHGRRVRIHRAGWYRFGRAPVDTAPDTSTAVEWRGDDTGAAGGE